MCALRTKGGVLEHEQGVQKCDGPQKNKKKSKRIWSPTHKLVQKSVFFGYAKLGTGAFTSTGREATTSKGDVREKCARACVCVSVCTTTLCE